MKRLAASDLLLYVLDVGKAIESLINAIESFINAIESFINAIESFINAMESLLNAIEFLINFLEPGVHLIHEPFLPFGELEGYLFPELCPHFLELYVQIFLEHRIHRDDVTTVITTSMVDGASKDWSIFVDIC
ncbi:unnamed protein product [Clonostachys byssicola]|uniref:Uncharacterized protein n=1 Tax=Clonostachys byssicola TaxID=160290 RepID=A0A9N9U7D2_9HYPO|nr:unnamed protein product [Clonostachys byssicola]